MEFDWDDAKSARCRRERGFSFADVVPAFRDPDRRAEVDERRDYGETRYMLYGRVAGRLFVIAYTMRARRPPYHLGTQGKRARDEALW